MAVKAGTVNSVSQLLQEIARFVTDPSYMKGEEWGLMSPATLSATTEDCILKGKGAGDDEIYVGLQVKKVSESQHNLLLNGFAGFDPHLEWYEQPGSIYKDGKSDILPCMPFPADVRMSYWLTANSQRITISVEVSNQYESAYLGFIKPIAIQRQYPYPLLVAGSAPDGTDWKLHSGAHSNYIHPVKKDHASSLCLRRPDGVWEYGGDNLAIWPSDTEPIDVLTVYNKERDTPDPEDHMLFPILLYEKNPTGILGELDGVYWIGNRADLAAKDSVTYNGESYRVLVNVYNRSDDMYHAVEWK